MEQHGSRWIMTKHSAFCLESFTLRRCATIWPQRWYGEVVAGSCYIVLLYNLLFVAEARVIIRSHWHPMISIYFGCQWCQNKENDTSPTSPVGSMMFDASAMRQRLQWSNVLKSGGWCLQCRPRRCNGSGQGLAALGGHGLEVSIDQRPSMWPLKSLNWFETDGFLRAKEVQQLEFIWFTIFYWSHVYYHSQHWWRNVNTEQTCLLSALHSTTYCFEKVFFQKNQKV